MEADAIIGCSVAACALIVIAVLVFWSRRRIDRIARDGYRSARRIEKGVGSDG
jgi:hypothetical protein